MVQTGISKVGADSFLLRGGQQRDFPRRVDGEKAINEGNAPFTLTDN